MPEETDPKVANRLKAAEALNHLDALAADPHFAWFMENVLEKARATEHDAALNTGKSAEERDRACWRHDLAKKLCGAVESLREMHGRAVYPNRTGKSQPT